MDWVGAYISSLHCCGINPSRESRRLHVAEGARFLFHVAGGGGVRIVASRRSRRLATIRSKMCCKSQNPRMSHYIPLLSVQEIYIWPIPTWCFVSIAVSGTFVHPGAENTYVHT